MYVVTIILLIYITIYIGFHPTSSARADEEVAVARATTCWELCSVGPYRIDVVAVHTVSTVSAVVVDVEAAGGTPFIAIGVPALAAFSSPSLDIGKVVAVFGAYDVVATTAASTAVTRSTTAATVDDVPARFGSSPPATSAQNVRLRVVLHPSPSHTSADTDAPAHCALQL